MIRFALIVASTLGFFLTAALGNFMVPLLRAFGPGQEPEAPPTSQLQPDSDPDDLPPPATPTMGGLCLMVGTLAAVGVGWTAACVAEPALLGDEGLWTTRLLIALFGALAFGAVGLADDLARLRRHAPLGLRRPVRLGLEAMESLYHRTPRLVRTSSIRCSTPPKVRAKSRITISGTIPSTAAMAAR